MKQDSAKITIKDVIEYLNKFDQSTKVILDKDGWEYAGDTFEIGDTPQITIGKSGLFYLYNSTNTLVINN